jgi:hypothetical protein
MQAQQPHISGNNIVRGVRPMVDISNGVNMNQQIEQLALQAGFNLHNDAIDGHDFKHEIEKFAELIIAECLNQVRDQYLPVLEDELMMKDTHWDGYVQCGIDCYVAIEEQFRS